MLPCRAYMVFGGFVDYNPKNPFFFLLYGSFLRNTAAGQIHVSPDTMRNAHRI